MNPETCPVSPDAPKCMPYPLNEHEAHILLIIWFVTLGAALGFMLAKVDWRLLWAVLKALSNQQSVLRKSKKS